MRSLYDILTGGVFSGTTATGNPASTSLAALLMPASNNSLPSSEFSKGEVYICAAVSAAIAVLA